MMCAPEPGPIVERMRVCCPDDSSRFVVYWRNERQGVYHFTRSETPLCVETDKDPRVRAIRKDPIAFARYVAQKHYRDDLPRNT